MKTLKVLSLFDGISVGQLALVEAMYGKDVEIEYLHGSIPYGKRYYNLTEGVRYRLERLTARELERLQTLPDDYTRYGYRDGKYVELGYHARHHAIGNAWTAEVIRYILSHMDF